MVTAVQGPDPRTALAAPAGRPPAADSRRVGGELPAELDGCLVQAAPHPVTAARYPGGVLAGPHVFSGIRLQHGRAHRHRARIPVRRSRHLGLGARSVDQGRRHRSPVPVAGPGDRGRTDERAVAPLRLRRAEPRRARCRDLPGGSRDPRLSGPRAATGPEGRPAGLRARSAPGEEGAGWLLVLAHDVARGDCELHVLDARDLAGGRHAAVGLPGGPPVDCRAAWVPAEALP
jgi:hypothetical protein